MNKSNNKRKKESKERIEIVFLELIKNKDINNISVSDICKKANLNRSTFYSNYIDIYDLVDKIRIRMLNEFLKIYQEEVKTKKHSYDFLKLFTHIKENQGFYKTYFKLNFDNYEELIPIDDDEVIRFFGTTKNVDYHITFFKAGISAVIKKWLNNGCLEEPEEIVEIFISEYYKKLP